MQQVVSITSQRQIYIPVPMYRALALDKYRKASLCLQNKRIIIEPIPDIMELEGVFSEKAFKNKPIEEIMKIEEKAFSTAIAAKFKRKK